MEDKAADVLVSTENAKIGQIIGVCCTLNQIPGSTDGTKYWKNLQQRARRNGWSMLKQVLVDAIKQKIRDEGGPVHRSYSGGVLVIDLDPCGGQAVYQTWDDIPDHDVPCPCGDRTHWLIRYHDLRPSKAK